LISGLNQMESKTKNEKEEITQIWDLKILSL
jgi:hypothetical protein